MAKSTEELFESLRPCLEEAADKILKDLPFLDRETLIRVLFSASTGLWPKGDEE